MTPELIAAYRFHKEHGGYATPPGKVACALAAAKAEIAARNLGWRVVWEYDDDPSFALDDHDEWCYRARQATYEGRDSFAYCDHDVMWAALYTDDDQRSQFAIPAASLSGIIDADHNYRRVIEAELALEALPRDIPAAYLYNCA